MESKDDARKYDYLAYQAYYGRRNGDGFYFNYDITPLIEDFSFTEFIAKARNTEHSSFLVITNNQYVIGYTASFGMGTHKAAYARAMKDLTGGGTITNEREVKKLETECTDTFLTARITYDYRGDNEDRTPIYHGAIYFKLPKGNAITKEQFEVFKQFYNDYNQELSVITRKYGPKKFSIQYEYVDEEGTKTMKISNSLDELYTYLETRIDHSKELNIISYSIFLKNMLLY